MKHRAVWPLLVLEASGSRRVRCEGTRLRAHNYATLWALSALPRPLSGPIKCTFHGTLANCRWCFLRRNLSDNAVVVCGDRDATWIFMRCKSRWMWRTYLALFAPLTWDTFLISPARRSLTSCTDEAGPAGKYVQSPLIFWRAVQRRDQGELGSVRETLSA